MKINASSLKNRGEIHLWSVKQRRIIRICKHRTIISGITFTKDAKILASAGHDGYLKIWDVERGKLIQIMEANYILKSEIAKTFPTSIMQQLEQKGCMKPISSYPGYFELNVDIIERERFQDVKEKLNILQFLSKKMKIRGCDFSPNSTEQMIACTNGLGDIYLWNLQNNDLLSFIPTEKASGPLAFMPDEDRLIVLMGEKCIKLLCWKTRQVIKRWAFSPIHWYYERLVLSKDRKLAIIESGRIVIWSIDDERPIKILHRGTRSFDIAGKPRCAAFSSNGELLAIASDQEIRIWSTRDWTLRYYLRGGYNVDVIDLQFVENDRCLISISPDANPTVWKFSNALLKRAETYAGPIESISVTSDDTYLLSLSLGILRVWNAKTGDFLWSLSDRVDQFTISKEGHYLLTQSHNRVILWDLKTRNQVTTLKRETAIQGIAFLPKERLVIIGTAMVEIYNIETKEWFFVLKGKVTSLTSYAFSSDEQWLAFGTQEGDVEAWNFKSGKVYRLKNAHSSEIKAIKFSANAIVSKANSSVHIWMPLEGLRYALNGFNDACMIDGVQRLFLLSNSTSVGVYIPKKNMLSLIRLLPILSEFSSEKRDPNILFLQDDYGQVKAWFKSEGIIYDIPNCRYSTSLTTMVLHPSHPILATALSNGMIQLWDITNGRLLNVLWGHSAAVTNLMFSVDGFSLLSCSHDYSLQRWDLKDGIDQATLQWRSEPYSLILHGMKYIYDDIRYEDIGNLLFDAETTTNDLLEKVQILRRKTNYEQRPYLFPSEGKNRDFSNIKVESYNLDQAIMKLHHEILKPMHDELFYLNSRLFEALRSHLLNALRSHLLNAIELMPSSFHLVLHTIRSVVESISLRMPVDPIDLCILQQINSSKAPDELFFVRDLLDLKLRKVISNLLRIIPCEIDPKVIEKVYEQAGNIFCKEGSHVQAIRCYTQSLLKNPKNAEIYYRRGILYLDQGQHDVAIKDFEQALLIDPHHTKSVSLLAQIKNGQLSCGRI